MNKVFADTSYFVALMSRYDRHHMAAHSWTERFEGRLITTSWVLAEVGNYLAKGRNRPLFLSLLDDLMGDRRVEIIPPDEAQFRKGVLLFRQRMDKDWSLTDCISFVIMTERELSEVVSTDRHFVQAGFQPVLL